jgi:transaldolase
LIVGPTVDGENRIWHLEEKAGADVVVTCPPSFIDKVLFLPGVEKIRFEKDRILQDIPADLLDKLMRVPYFEKGYAVDGYTRDEYNTHPALQRTAEQFSKATEEMVEFAGRCLNEGACFT